MNKAIQIPALRHPSIIAEKRIILGQSFEFILQHGNCFIRRLYRNRRRQLSSLLWYRPCLKCYRNMYLKRGV